jgi:carboxyl-terminal processing protease
MYPVRPAERVTSEPMPADPVPPPSGDQESPDQAAPTAPLDPQLTALLAAGAQPPPNRLVRPLSIAIVIVAILAGSGLFLSGYSLGRNVATTPGTPAGETEAFQAFWDAYRAVTDRYAGGEVDRKALIEGAIKGLFQALGDPYSSYLTSQEYKDSLRGISGEFEGIGAQITTRSPEGTDGSCSPLGPECALVITNTLDGSPAEGVGLQPDDVITAIDGETVDGLSVDEARDRIRGPRDTVVTLTILRGGSPIEVDVTRAVIIEKEVITETYGGGTVGYVKLTGFSEHASDEFAKVIAADVEAGRKKLILDLRGNPGGFVTAAREIASQYLADGTIFWQEDADGNLTETTAVAGGAATDPSIELILLIDKGSASASEIVAGALRDRERATLIGETTFGKGTVQQWTPLEGDHGGFRLTVAKWLTPDKTWIHGTGIAPDIVVTPVDGVDDAVLDRALAEFDVAPVGAVWDLAA